MNARDSRNWAAAANGATASMSSTYNAGFAPSGIINGDRKVPPVRSLSATLDISDPYSVAAPILSWWGLCVVLLSTAGIAFAVLRKRAAGESRLGVA